MFFELPLTTAEEIAVEFRPDGRTQVKGALRTLRDRDAVSSGITAPVRESTGRVQGTLHVYCSLNRDAARLARHRRDEEAKRLAAAAERIEKRKETQQLTTFLARARADIGEPFSAHRAFEWGPHEERMAAIQLAGKIAVETGKARRRVVKDAVESEAPLFAHVVKLHGNLAELKVHLADAQMTVPADDLRERDLAFVGASLLLRWEHWGHGRTLLTTEPALEIDAGAGDTPPIYPYERPLPSASEHVRLAETLAARPATVRRPRRIPIGD